MEALHNLCSILHGLFLRNLSDCYFAAMMAGGGWFVLMVQLKAAGFFNTKNACSVSSEPPPNSILGGFATSWQWTHQLSLVLCMKFADESNEHGERTLQLCLTLSCGEK